LEVMTISDHVRGHLIIARWAKHFDRCADCGTTERAHLSLGLCTACYQRHRYWQ
jgi:hypothetical protein